jgi:predicted DNA binding CopG/RHH family protein
MTKKKTRLTVDLESETHRRVKTKASQEGLTMSTVVRRLVNLWLGEKISITKCKDFSHNSSRVTS